MEKAPVNFKQQRDFGEVFNATFAFIGQEFKPLGKALLYYVLPILIIAAFLSVLVSIGQQKYLHSFQAGSADITANPFAAMGSTLKYSLLSMLVYLLAFSALRCTIYGYIKVYVEKGKDQFTTEDIWSEIKKFILPVLGTSIVIGLLIGVGFVFCIIPGIWLGISLSAIYIAMIYEGKGMGDAFNRSFNLTKQDWWTTLGIIFVSYIIVYILSIIMAVPAVLMGLKSFFTAFKDLQSPVEMNFSTTFYIINSITSLVTYILFTIPFIAIAFQYFNLLEMKEKPSLKEKIEQIG
jgi:hypothetical protein